MIQVLLIHLFKTNFIVYEDGGGNTVYVTTPSSGPIDENGGKSSAGLIIGVIIAVIVLIVLAVFAWKYFSSNGGNKISSFPLIGQFYKYFIYMFKFTTQIILRFRVCLYTKNTK